MCNWLIAGSTCTWVTRGKRLSGAQIIYQLAYKYVGDRRSIISYNRRWYRSLIIINNIISCDKIWNKTLCHTRKIWNSSETDRKMETPDSKSMTCLLLQLISFKIFKVSYLPAIMSNFDACGWYDRIIKAIATIHDQQSGATQNTVRTSCLVKRDAKHKVETAHGISSYYFSGGLFLWIERGKTEDLQLWIKIEPYQLHHDEDLEWGISRPQIHKHGW